MWHVASRCSIKISTCLLSHSWSLNMNQSENGMVYIYIYMCVCVYVCVYFSITIFQYCALFLTPLLLEHFGIFPFKEE